MFSGGQAVEAVGGGGRPSREVVGGPQAGRQRPLLVHGQPPPLLLLRRQDPQDLGLRHRSFLLFPTLYLSTLSHSFLVMQFWLCCS